MNEIMSVLRDKRRLTVIPYKINEVSSYNTCYLPLNILVDNPLDPNSRWSTSTNDHRQFIILEYSPSIVSTITFGKYNKIHVCNIKEMRISVSYNKDTWTEVFYGGLKNDTTNETHNLIFYNNDFIISRYMKIEPLAAWGMNFNYSIWYVQLKGSLDSSYKKIILEREKINDIKLVKYNINKYGEEILIDRDIIDTYIKRSMYDELEEYILKLPDDMFTEYIKKSPYIGKWTEIKHTDKCEDDKCRDKKISVCKDANCELKDCCKIKYEHNNTDGTANDDDCIHTDITDNITNNITDGLANNITDNITDIIDMQWPCSRGGHQMAPTESGIYLYGGWDGMEELGDMWIYNGNWKCLIKSERQSLENNTNENKNTYLCNTRCRNETKESRVPYYIQDKEILETDTSKSTSTESPKKRSCHKMCTYKNRIFLTGKYISTIERSSENSDCELWMYDGKWSCLKNEGDVLLNVYDHYMAVGNDSIYIFGGKITNFEDSFGGLYKISIDKKFVSATWTKIFDSTNQPLDSPILKGRLGHILLYIDILEYKNTLAIIGGQRAKEYYRSISLYSLDTLTFYESIPFPIETDGRVIQRSILYKEDILIYFTYGKDKEGKLEYSKLYSYNLIYKKWNEVEMDSNGPMPRTAYQFVHWQDQFFLFGGNVLDTRQSDFWSLNLLKISTGETRKLAVMTVRKHKFFRMYKEDKRKGLEYLRTKLKECITNRRTKNIFEETCYEILKRTSDASEDIRQYINYLNGK